MKVVILAGGYGSRLFEETERRPKPMVEINGYPILWHIMKHYYAYGFDDFVILCGYKGHAIKEYFVNYCLHHSDVVVDTTKQRATYSNNQAERWRVTLLDTGLDTMTGGRLKRAESLLGGEPFFLTYGDGVSDVDLTALLDFHRQRRGICTLTAVQPEGRFGVLRFAEGDSVARFNEKPEGDGSWINGGFFVFEPEIFAYLDEGDSTVLERAPLSRLAAESKLFAYRHSGFWRCMDTIRDKLQLERLWKENGGRWRA
jgi:glucose-1-phosphate cytidylyltransferase